MTLEVDVTCQDICEPCAMVDKASTQQKPTLTVSYRAHISVTVVTNVMNSASLNLGIETYKCKPLYSIVSRPRVILRRDWLICVT